MLVEKTEFIGRHEHRFQPPNRVYIVLHGVIDAREIEAQNAFLRDRSEEAGKRLRSICNLDDFEGMTTDARRYIVKMDREYPYVGMAFAGGNFMSRTVAGTVLRAARHLAPHHFTFPIFFGKTIEECEKWLDGVESSSGTKSG